MINFLRSLFEETYISDIVVRYNVCNRTELEELLSTLSSALESLTNPTKLLSTERIILHLPIMEVGTIFGIL